MILRSFTAAAGACALVVAAAPPSAAHPGAALEQASRPCVTDLVDPRLAPRCRPAAKGGQNGPERVVDCDRPDAQARFEQLQARARPGDVVVFRARNRSCTFTPVVSKPLTLVAEPSRFGPPVLAPSGGGHCLRVEAHGEVVLRGLTMLQEGAAGACIVAGAGHLRIEGGRVVYDGRDSAVVVRGGRLTLRDGARIVARSLKPAIDVAGGLDLSGGRVSSTGPGVVYRPAADTDFQGGLIERLDDWSGTDRASGAYGVAVLEAASGSLTRLSGLSVDGFSRGVYVSGGGEYLLENLRVTGAGWALVSEAGKTTVSGGDLEAEEVGYFAAGRLSYLTGARIYGVRRAGIFAETGSQVRSVDVRVFTHAVGCEALESVPGAEPLSCAPWHQSAEFRTRETGRRRFSEFLSDRY